MFTEHVWAGQQAKGCPPGHVLFRGVVNHCQTMPWGPGSFMDVLCSPYHTLRKSSKSMHGCSLRAVWESDNVWSLHASLFGRVGRPGVCMIMGVGTRGTLASMELGTIPDVGAQLYVSLGSLSAYSQCALYMQKPHTHPAFCRLH